MKNLNIYYYSKPINIPYDVWLGLRTGITLPDLASQLFSVTGKKVIVKFKSFFTITQSFFGKKLANHFFFRKKVLLLNPKY